MMHTIPLNKKVTFSQTYILGGKEVSEITLRRPTYRDQKIAEGSANTVFDAQDQYIRLLSGIDNITTEELDAIFMDDLKLMQDVVDEWMGKRNTIQEG